MIKYFNLVIMLVGTLFFVACGGGDGASNKTVNTDVKALLEGKPFYTIHGFEYRTDKYKDGIVEVKTYNLSTNELIRSYSLGQYTFDDNIVIFKNITNNVEVKMIITSITNGIKVTNTQNSMESFNMYNSLEDAKANTKDNNIYAKSLLEGKTLYFINNTRSGEGEITYTKETYTNGILELNVYVLSTNKLLGSLSYKYTFENNLLVLTNTKTNNINKYIITSVSSGIKFTMKDNSSSITIEYKTLEEAKANISAELLLEGRTLYFIKNTEINATYIKETYTNGTLEMSSYLLETNKAMGAITYKYSFHSNLITLTDPSNSNVFRYIVTSITNGVKFTNEKDSSIITDEYNSLEDAKENLKN